MRIAIVGGGGGVGSSVAFNLLLAGRYDEVVLVDSRPNMVASHVLDLEQVLELAPGASIRGGGDADVADADVLVVAAGAPLTVNTSRAAYLEDNARIAGGVAGLIPRGWPGLLILVTNPVDVLVTWLRSRTGLDRRRVIGYTLNDSLRLRTGVGRTLGLEPGRVEAWMVGEHGDSNVPLYDDIRVDGERAGLSPGQKAEVEEFVRTFYARHVALDSGRSSTWTSGLGIARMVRALEAGGETWPASVVLDGEYGIEGVAVSVPVDLGPGGVERIQEWPLSPESLAALRASAELVRGLAASIRV